MFGQVSNNSVKGELSEIWTIEKQKLCDFKLSFFLREMILNIKMGFNVVEYLHEKT